MKKSTVFFIHIIYWLVYAAFCFSLVLVANSMESNSRQNPGLVFVFLLMVGCLNHYLFYSILVPRFLAKRKNIKFLLSAVAASLGFALIILTFQLIAIGRTADFYSDPKELDVGILVTWSLLVMVYTILALVNGLLATLMRGAISWYGEIHVKEVLASRYLQTELALLRAKINPHFLFNTLNNIHILIDRNPGDASLYLLKLSEILRFTLYDTKDDKIPLSQEFEYISKYIDLQNIRTSNPNFVHFKVQGDYSKLKIAPLLFIPFIENAFKHSSNKRIDDSIYISINVLNERVDFHCRNIVNLENVRYPSNDGIGLDLMRQRLKLLYNESHELSIIQSNSTFDVRLTLYIHDN